MVLRGPTDADALLDLARSLGARVQGFGDFPTVVVEHEASGNDFIDLAGTFASLIEVNRSSAQPRRSRPRVVFLDIETTGLNAGAGTLVFLVGLATVDGPSVTVRQYFLHEPAGEPGMLASVAEIFGDFDTIITFNGRRFDVPMLVGRFDLHGLPDPVPGHHIDLLQPSRRIWARRLGQSNLATLESRVLGTFRHGDSPGSEAPRRYFEFLHERRIESILPVLDHNRQDLLSMVRLASRIGLMLGLGGQLNEAMPSDLLGLGSLFEDAGRTDSAIWSYEAALVGASTVERADALYRLARLADRAVSLDRVMQLLATVSDFNVDRAVVASIELAKILEHRRREPEAALRYARRALALMGVLRSPTGQRLAPEIRTRITRLERKVARIDERATVAPSSPA